MYRLTFRVAVAFLTFIIGVTAASLWLISHRSHDVPLPVVAKPERTYERGPAGEAPEGSFITLESSDGMRFTKWSVYCGTPERATRELQKRLKKSVEIVSREQVLSEGGQQIGEKVVAVFSSNVPDDWSASLLWTEREKLFQVESASLQNILEYRKDFKR